ncbi:hypothetical protein EP7_002958 [Isosphaeraceae bacterium EP7]
MNPGAFDRLAPRIFTALLCLYAPYAWLAFTSHPLDAYRLHWIKMWPILPGLLVGVIPAVHRQPDWVGFSAMGLATVSILGLVALLLSKGRRLAIGTLVVAGLLSCLNSMLANGLFWF